MIFLFLFLIGICIGSFLNVVIDRIPQRKSIIVGRSHCDFCKHLLSWYDLFPIFSFILLGGKCRYCGEKLSFQYPLIEFTTGILFVAVFIFEMNAPRSTIFLYGIDVVLTVIGFALAVMDIKYNILSDNLLFIFGIFSLARLFLQNPSTIPFHIVLAFLSCIPFLLIFFLSKGRGMGFGDVKLSFLMGFLLGFPGIIIALYTAFLTGGIAGFILIIAKKKKLKHSTIAFGPFLLIGTAVAALFGNTLWSYAKLFLGI